MSSNVSVVKSQVPNIPGTKPATRNAQLLVSSGIPSLDHFIGMIRPDCLRFQIYCVIYNIYFC